MPLADLKFKPGINNEITPFSEENGWTDGDKIRFRLGYPEKLGGWVRNTNNNFLGICRGLHEFVALNSDRFLGLGTEQKFYIKQGTAFNDVTPIRRTTTGTATFSAVTTSPFSSTLTVTDPNHGAVVDDFVTFSNADALGGNMTAGTLNQEYQIRSIINGNTYAIRARLQNTSIAFLTRTGGVFDENIQVPSNASDVGNGEVGTPNTTATYQINTGLNSSVQGGAGWGVGLWGGTTDGATVVSPFGSSLNLAAGDTQLTVAANANVADGDILFLPATGLSESQIATVAGSRTISDAVGGTWWGGRNPTGYVINPDSYQPSSASFGHIPTLPNNVRVISVDQVNKTALLSEAATGNVASDLGIALSVGELVRVASGGGTTSLVIVRGLFGTSDVDHSNGQAVLSVGNASASNDYVGWGEAINQDAANPDSTLRIWSQDNFGENLLHNDRNGGIFFWDRQKYATTTGYRSENLATLTDIAGNSVTRTSVPTRALQVMLSDRDRHVIAFGCDGLGSNSTDVDGDGVADPLLIRFSSSENPVQWYPTSSNSAGDLRISSGSTIIQAVETRQQIIVFTDVSLHAMQFLGAPFTFGINLISENITIASPKAAVAIDDSVFWMGSAEFYIYAGAVQKIPCTVRDFVFNNLNNEQREKIIGGANVSFSEVWWFYPSEDSTENDRYVVYNYLEKVWFTGTLNRSAWLDRGISTLPLATSATNYLYNHETGSTFSDEVDSESYITSGDISLSEGNQFAFIRRVIPDVDFRSKTTETSLNFVLTVRDFPGQAFLDPSTNPKTPLSSSTNSILKTSTTPVDQYTYQYFTRLRGRSFSFKVSSTDDNVLWRLGVPRIEIRPDGRR